jgi:hypothetical protein
VNPEPRASARDRPAVHVPGPKPRFRPGTPLACVCGGGKGRGHAPVPLDPLGGPPRSARIGSRGRCAGPGGRLGPGPGRSAGPAPGSLRCTRDRRGRASSHHRNTSQAPGRSGPRSHRRPRARTRRPQPITTATVRRRRRPNSKPCQPHTGPRSRPGRPARPAPRVDPGCFRERADHRGAEPGHAAHDGPGRARASVPGHGPAHGRDRHRQGGPGPDHPFRESPSRPALRGHQLRGLPGHAAGERALRTRSWRLHGRRS